MTTNQLLTDAMALLKTIRKSAAHYMCRLAPPFDYRCNSCKAIDNLLEREAKQ
jgi:hypothetical protein